MTQTTQLTPAQKKAALTAFLQKDDRICFADMVDNSQQVALKERLIEILLNDEPLCGKALHSGAHFILYPGETLPIYTPALYPEWEGAIVVPVAIEGSDAAATIKKEINAAIERQGILVAERDPSMPLSAKGGDATNHGLIFGMGVDVQSSINIDRTMRRPAYDPRAETLPEGMAHTNGHLRKNGKARIGEDAGGRWLWELDHDYVLSDEALAKKPARWFRDICVICGVSTAMLEILMGTHRGTWAGIQNEFHKNPSDNILKALNCMLTQPVTVNAKYVRQEYMLPAGSLFGLKTVERQADDGSTETIVDPAELHRISKALFGRSYTPPPPAAIVNPEHILKQLTHLSKAYMQGAISADELRALHIPALPLRTILAEYGFNAKYRAGSKEYHAVQKFCNAKDKANNIIPIIETLKAINTKYFHIDDVRFEQYMRALQRLPKGELPVMTELSPEEAFLFAKCHHDDTLSGFLRIYSKAMGKKAVDIAGFAKMTMAPHALALANPWQLPYTGTRGNIQPHVVKYVGRFRQDHYQPPPESHWFTAQEALEQFAGEDARESSHAEKLLEGLNQAIAVELKKYPGEPYPLITLPDGKTEVLVKNTPGEPPKLLDLEIRRWAYPDMLGRVTSDWREKVIAEQHSGRNGKLCVTH